MKAIIIGGGITGPALSIGLQKLGYRVSLLDSNPESIEVGGGIGLAPNGVKMIKKYIDEQLLLQILKVSVEQTGLTYKGVSGNTIFSKGFDFSSRYGAPFLGIKRHDLRTILLQFARNLGVELRFNHRLSSLEQTKSKVKALFENGTVEEGDLLFGCDGNKSKVRENLYEANVLNYTGMTSVLGVSKLDHKFQCDEYFHFYKGTKLNMGFYKISANEYFWFYPRIEPLSPVGWGPLTVEKIDEYKYLTEEFYSPIPALIKNTSRSMKVGLFDLKTLPQWYQGRILLLGDAIHPISPHLGQGASLALEDVAILLELMKVKPKANHEDLFQKVQMMRKDRTVRMINASRHMGKSNYKSDNWFTTISDFTLKLMVNYVGLAALDTIYGYDFKLK